MARLGSKKGKLLINYVQKVASRCLPLLSWQC